jgi:hypothetical protein
MCTVTILPLEQGFRLACNRDELRVRPAALAPVLRTLGSRQALMPVDPVSGGTWIAVHDAGLAMTLLNVNPDQPDPARWAGRRSRGLLIPGLLDAATVREAYPRALALDAAAFPPFRLVMIDRRQWAQVRSDGGRVIGERYAGPSRPVMFTSSGLGDAVVEGPRRELFDQWFAAAGDPVERQDAFHRHRWADRPHLSVCMARPDARTVSLTTVQVAADAIRLTYHGAAPDEPAVPVSLTLAARVDDHEVA